MSSIGYGVSDYYFGGCWAPFLLVLCQICTAITFDAVAIGLLFQRISRGHKRAKTILFSKTACAVQDRDGQYCILFRVAELRHLHPLLNVSVHAYCIRHERYRLRDGTVRTVHCVTKPVALQPPSQHLYMRLPQVLCHRVDAVSPFRPGRQQRDGTATSSWCDAEGMEHIVDEPLPLEEFWHDRETELVVLVEGIDELTSAVTQSRHSYTTNVEWNRTFVDCITVQDEQEVIVDLTTFHETQAVDPEEGLLCPWIDPE
jgi:Inward rectifier potassium channel C-terminal domain